MCRWMVYIGPKMRLSSLITKPKNGIVQQAIDAVSYTPGLKSNHQRNHQVNADGFGISFYDDNKQPHTYRSTKPAWSDTNLTTLCDNINTNLTLAHVRAATPGLAINDANCHPFTFNQLTFMHNGGIGGFNKMKRPLSYMFADSIWHNVQGDTDSEYCFHYFLQHLFTNNNKDYDELITQEEMENALRQTIDGLQDLQRKYGDANDIDEQSASMNFCVSNGTEVVASRMRRPIIEDSPSLYLGSGSDFQYDDEEEVFRFGTNNNAETTVECNGKQLATIISSEPLTKIESDWTLIPEETLVSINADGEVKLSSLL